MSAIPCPVCGKLRKVEQIATPEGWANPPCWRCGDPGWTQPYFADDPLAGRPDSTAADDAFYRVWFELDPLPGWLWWLVRRKLSWPTQGMWLRKAEGGVRQMARQRGLTLIGDPLAEAVKRGRQIVLRASALATGQPDPSDPIENGPVDLVDQEDGEH